MSNRLQAVRGFNDVLWPETVLWQKCEAILRDCLTQYAYQEIKLPFLESTALFKRSIGEVTDIVEKEMYTFVDLNGDSLSLRPEGTAGSVRAAIEHSLLRQTQKFWYFGPMFRHEKPQKGRYRQFYQLGVETFGLEGRAIELELLQLCADFWQKLGIADKLELQINCLGDLEDRQHFKTDLVDYFEQHIHQLTEAEVSRLKRNPLRLLDSKAEHIQTLLLQAPKLIDYISADAKTAFEMLCQGLSALGIPYRINPYLVRGLDYYKHLVFEWVSDELGSQATVCAGGRYDDLVTQLGGNATAALGFALGFERLLLLMNNTEQAECACDVYLLTQEAQPLIQTLRMAKMIRDCSGLRVEMSHVPASIKSQFKKADRSGARFALILGETELQNDEITVKLLRQQQDEDKQLILPQNQIVSWLAEQGV